MSKFKSAFYRKYQLNTQQVDKIKFIGNIKILHIKLKKLLGIKLLAGELKISLSKKFNSCLLHAILVVGNGATQDTF